MLYLDNNATTRPAPAVVDAMLAALRDGWHNPSSIHRPGQEARRRIELARADVARLINARPQRITFTSGGTEAIDTAIRGILQLQRADGRNAIVTSRIEHSAVRDLVTTLDERGEAEARWLPVGRDGVIDFDALEAALDDRVALVCVQWANNETGVIQPVRRIGELCRRRTIPFLCDGTQWIGKMPADMQAMPIDLLVFSPHKFHGPKGVGVLYTRPGVSLPARMLGSQEGGRRGGTENTSGVVGLAAACELARNWLADPANRERAAALRDQFEQGVLERIPDAVINGRLDDRDANRPSEDGGRLWNTSNIGFPGMESETLLIMFSERGLCASAGAACSSGSLEPSPVLVAMGVPDRVGHGAVRFSLSRETAPDEIAQAVEIVADTVQRLRDSASALMTPS